MSIRFEIYMREFTAQNPPATLEPRTPEYLKDKEDRIHDELKDICIQLNINGKDFLYYNQKSAVHIHMEGNPKQADTKKRYDITLIVQQSPRLEELPKELSDILTKYKFRKITHN